MNDNIVPGFDSHPDAKLGLLLRKVDEKDRSLEISACGDLDTYNTESFLARMTKVIEAGFVHLVIDMTRVRFASSTGIGALVLLLKQVRSLGGELVLVGVQPMVHEVLQLLGFAHYFIIKETAVEPGQHLGCEDPAGGEATSFVAR
jgi:anti-sigma B factor antagonist